MRVLKLTLLFVLFIHFANGKFRVNLYGGYVLDDKFDSYVDPYNYFNGKIKGGFQFGAGLEYYRAPYNGLELIFIGQKTYAPINYYPNSIYTSPNAQYKKLDLNLNYLLVGFTRYFAEEDSKINPYFTFMLGTLFAGAHDNETGEDRDAVKFTWGFKGGTNFRMSDNLAIKLQAMLLSTTQTAGGTLYFGSGGYGPGTTTPSSMLQLSFSTGIVYTFGKKVHDEE